MRNSLTPLRYARVRNYIYRHGFRFDYFNYISVHKIQCLSHIILLLIIRTLLIHKSYNNMQQAKINATWLNAIRSYITIIQTDLRTRNFWETKFTTLSKIFLFSILLVFLRKHVFVTQRFRQYLRVPLYHKIHYYWMTEYVNYVRKPYRTVLKPQINNPFLSYPCHQRVTCGWLQTIIFPS